MSGFEIEKKGYKVNPDYINGTSNQILIKLKDKIIEAPNRLQRVINFKFTQSCQNSPTRESQFLKNHNSPKLQSTHNSVNTGRDYESRNTSHLINLTKQVNKFPKFSILDPKKIGDFKI
jgi:hypothetical protein